MKKATGIVLKIFLGLILLFLILVFTVPAIFKEKIKEKVEQIINESINAKVEFGDYHLGLFRSFPNLAFSLDNLSITGIDKFENDTLAFCESVALVLNLASLFSQSGYEVKSVSVNNAEINAIVLNDGSANWDIVADTTESIEDDESQSEMKILLKKVDLKNISLSYLDYESDIKAFLKRLNGSMKGDLTQSETNLEIELASDEVVYLMDGLKYLNNAKVVSDMKLRANLDSMNFYFDDAFLKLNDLKVNLRGMIAMPEDDIETDLSFSTEETSFKALLSLVPAFYLNDFENLQADGEFSLNCRAHGIYSDADSTLPDISLNLSVTDGSINYTSLPEQIRNIDLMTQVYIDGKDMDRSTVNIESFHMELAGNPFDMKLELKTPLSDPDFTGSMLGKIDLTAFSNALPLDSLNLSGLVDVSLNIAGRMSMIEKEEYDKFEASGKLDINNLMISMPDYPQIKINDAAFQFGPSYASLAKASLNIGSKSDFSLQGKLENYIPFLLKDEIIYGNMSLQSDLVDLSDIMSYFPADTAVNDTSVLSIIKVPENINFDFDALINEFLYDKIKVRNLKGHIMMKEGILSVEKAAMDLLGGTITMNAEYDTRDTLKPFMKAELNMQEIGIKDAFNTFNTIRVLAPTAKGINGKVGMQLNYSSLFRNDFMPVIPSINGGGKLQSEEVTLVESAVYNNMKEVLKLGSNYSNTFKDINVSFKVNDGRIYVSPFNTKVGNIRMNIGGDQGIDQTINYIIKTEIPRSDLGSSVNSLIDNLSVQAAAFGLAFKPSEIIKVNVRVTGTFLKPVVTPFFGNTPPDSARSIKETARETVVSAVGEKIDEAKEKVKTEVEIQAEKIVEEAEEKADQLRDEAEKAAMKIRTEADKQSEKIIKEAESRGAIAKLAAQKTADSIKKEADKRADQIIKEADEKALKLVEEARAKSDELLGKM